jgi:hypothetical protein
MLNEERLGGSGHSAALIRRAAIMTPLWYWSKGESESELSVCSMMGAGGGSGGKLYIAARVAMLGETWETLAGDSDDQDMEE